MTDYNPYILGFVHHRDQRGDLWLPLQEALSRFGDLPSRYGLLPSQQGRRQRPSLNLALGAVIQRALERTSDLKRVIHDFYTDWHRDWRHEFDIDPEPLFNRLDGESVVRWLARHRDTLERIDRFPLRRSLEESGLIRRDVLNSIPDARLLEKSIEMLERRQRRLADGAGGWSGSGLLQRLRLRRGLDRLGRRIGVLPSRIDPALARVYADELNSAFGLFCDTGGISCDGLQPRQGRGVEFEYARRDRSFLSLGSEIGDCTARPWHQIDRHTENIYWTVMPWLLDRNYQILKVHWDGHLVMKVHLLPLATYEAGGLHMFLAVDAMETGLVLRHDIEGEGRLPVATVTEILEQTRSEILRIADAMGMEDVYAELFSNNPLLREWLQGQERIFLDVNRLHKVDDLEDVFELGCRLARECDMPEPGHLFMEIQFRNTQLMSHQTQRRTIKGFASLRRGRLSGLAMGHVIGV